MLRLFFRAARDWGWALALAVGLLALAAPWLADEANAPMPLPGDRTVAFAPGSPFDVAKWCKDVAETVQLELAPDASSARYVAARGAERVEWTVNPGGDADRYYRDSQGQQQREGVLVTESALPCMTTPR